MGRQEVRRLIESLNGKLADLSHRINKLYAWYVSPFRVTKTVHDSSWVDERLAKLPNWGVGGGRIALDGRYYTVSLEDFKRMIDWDWVDAKRYELEKFDCDDYAMLFKARMAFEFGVNAIGYVIDWSAGHAYNVVLVEDYDGPLLFEPQNDKVFSVEGRDKRFYRLENYVILI